MRQKKPPAPKKGAPAYMNTYGDMMTLLMTFFVLMFSMSSVDEGKFSAAMNSLEIAIGMFEPGEIIDTTQNTIFETGDESAENIDLINEMQGTLQDFQYYIEEANLGEDVRVERDGLEVILTFDDILLFETGKANIKPPAIPALSKLGEKLREYLKQGYFLSLEGHTDNVPINTVQFPSNWELSAVRAISVAKFYIYEMDFPASQISAEGFGEQQPIAPNDTPENRSKNRRVELKLTKKVSDKK